MGHCVTPVPYAFSPALTQKAMSQVGMDSIMDFLKEFTGGNQSHAVGTNQSKAGHNLQPGPTSVQGQF